MTTSHPPAPPSQPCGSCPYRRDVPPGIWDASEYDKLQLYDGETWEQSPALFMCHQRDRKLCGGWLACHDTDHLLALRIHPVDPSAYGYLSQVPVFSSGAEARSHGISRIAAPPTAARRMMAAIERKRTKESAQCQRRPK